MQETALPALLADPPENMIAQSQSGTGKTAAFTLAMLSRVDTSLNYPQVTTISILILKNISNRIQFHGKTLFLYESTPVSTILN